MQQLKAGDLVALRHQERNYIFLILSKSAFFGCQWAFALHETYEKIPIAGALELSPQKGFVALIDFIEPRRSDDVIRIAKNLDVAPHMSFSRTKALIRSYPFDGTAVWYIYDLNSAILEKKQSLSTEELHYPIWSGMKSSEVFELVDARWSPDILVSVAETGQYPRQAANKSLRVAP